MQKTQSVFKCALLSSLDSEFDGNGVSLAPIVELPLAGCEEMPIKVQHCYLEEVSEKENNILSAGSRVNVSPFILALRWGIRGIKGCMSHKT